MKLIMNLYFFFFMVFSVWADLLILMFHSGWNLEETFLGYGVCWIISKIIFIRGLVILVPISCLAPQALQRCQAGCSWTQCSWNVTVSVESRHHLEISFPFLECKLGFLPRVSPIFIRSWWVKNSMFSHSCLTVKTGVLFLSSWKWIRNILYWIFQQILSVEHGESQYINFLPVFQFNIWSTAAIIQSVLFDFVVGIKNAHIQLCILNNSSSL